MFTQRDQRARRARCQEMGLRSGGRLLGMRPQGVARAVPTGVLRSDRARRAEHGASRSDPRSRHALGRRRRTSGYRFLAGEQAATPRRFATRRPHLHRPDARSGGAHGQQDRRAPRGGPRGRSCRARHRRSAPRRCVGRGRTRVAAGIDLSAPHVKRKPFQAAAAKACERSATRPIFSAPHARRGLEPVPPSALGRVSRGAGSQALSATSKSSCSAITTGR